MKKSIFLKNIFSIHLPYILVLLLLLNACATNPATKRMELMLVSENKEFDIGKGVDKQVREEMGVYLEKPELRNLVKEIAENIGKKSHRPNLIYRAEIVDTPDFNAFAVPGGFVYVHRGLLERMNSLDELASVMGHEIAHVAARHSASQISKMQLSQIGLLVATIATGGELQNYGDLINIGAALAFNKFSRDDERQADYLGIKYMSDAGYNPKGAVEAMKTINKINEREPGVLETWFMTHPPTSERIDTLTGELDKLSTQNPGLKKREMRRNEFIKLLDGMAVGAWNGKELVKGERYYNKEFMLSIPIPEAWQVHINHKEYTAIFSDTRNKSYAIFDIEALQKRTSTPDYFDKIISSLKRQRLKQYQDSKNPENLPHGAMSARFSGRGNQGPVDVHVAAFVKEDRGYSITKVSEGDSSKSTSNIIGEMINGLTFLSQGEADKIEPPRMKVHEVKRGETWDSIATKYYKKSDEKIKLAEYNGFTTDKSPSPGVLLKIPPTLRFK
jgi:predicted Zn-dependent protease